MDSRIAKSHLFPGGAGGPCDYDDDSDAHLCVGDADDCFEMDDTSRGRKATGDPDPYAPGVRGTALVFLVAGGEKVLLTSVELCMQRGPALAGMSFYYYTRCVSTRLLRESEQAARSSTSSSSSPSSAGPRDAAEATADVGGDLLGGGWVLRRARQRGWGQQRQRGWGQQREWGQQQWQRHRPTHAEAGQAREQLLPLSPWPPICCHTHPAAALGVPRPHCRWGPPAVVARTHA